MTRPAKGNGHERWEGDAAAYALGALERHELRPFEEHLAGCAQCQRDLAAMRSAVEELPAVAPALAAPPELEDRVMGTVRAEGASQAASADPATRRERRRHARAIMLWGRWPAPVLAAAAAAVVALIVVIGALSLGDGRSAPTYAGIVYAPGASASVRVSGSQARLSFSRLPAPPARRIYQVWLKRAAPAPVPTQSLFQATTGSVDVPGNLRGVQAVLVTAEPRPHGSLAPTRAPIIVVRLA